MVIISDELCTAAHSLLSFNQPISHHAHHGKDLTAYKHCTNRAI